MSFIARLNERKYDSIESIIMPEVEDLLGTTIAERLGDLKFFERPASAHHHGHEAGDLARHSHIVANALTFLTEQNGLRWQRPESPKIIGYLHDLCKVKDYKENPCYPGGFPFIYNDEKLLPGHAEVSLLLIAQLDLQLTEEEMFCIRWHMGAFDDKDNWQYYTRAIRRYPNVLWTHQADMVAAHIVNI